MDLGRGDLERAGAALAQPERGLWIAPIRHHSPACAWALRAMIREIRPTHVLIEGPEDFTRHVEALLHPETRPPVAILALAPRREGGVRRSFSFPLSAHSPEYVALREGRALGAALSFVDLASGESFEEEGEPPPPDDSRFTVGAYVAALLRRTGRRDGDDLWDHLFESRLGGADWRGFFADLGAYCLGLRAASPPDARTLRREARMAAHLSAVLAGGGRVVAAVGGYHAPALAGAPPAPKPLKPGEAAESWLVRSDFAALDAAGGYAAGLRAPGYYDRLWTAAEAAGDGDFWRAEATAILGEFARLSRAEGRAAPFPALMEAVRLAESLALLRGRPGPMREELREAVRTAFAKGEASDAALWEARFAEFLRGDRLGEVPRRTSAPPIVEEARARARHLRFQIEDGAQRLRRLELRRKDSHRAAAEFLRLMALLGTGFCELKPDSGSRFVSGPDLARLHEHWSYAWSARVEAALIVQSSLGTTLAGAGIGRLKAEYLRLEAQARRDDAPERVALLARGVQAGLSGELGEIVALLARDLASARDFAALARALRGLVFMDLPTHPLRAPETLGVKRLIRTAFRRLILLCENLAGLREFEQPAAVEAIRLVVELLRGPEGEGLGEDGATSAETLFAEALDRLAENPQTPPRLLGAALGAGAMAGRRMEAELAAALRGRLRGMDLGKGRTAMLSGMLAAAPGLLAKEGPVLAATDDFLQGLEERELLALLPELRDAFSALNFEEKDRLAARLALRHAEDGGAGRSFSAEERRRAAEADRALEAAILQEGLSGWLSGEDAA